MSRRVSKLKEKRQKKQLRTIIIVAAAVLVMLAAVLIGVAANSDLGHDHDHEHSHGATVELRVGFDASGDSAIYEAVQQFKSEVEQESDGAIQVTVYGNGQYGKGKTLVGALQNGGTELDIVITDVKDFTDVDARMDISSLPFIFDSYEDAWAFLDGDTQERVEKELIAHNIRVLSHYSKGFDYMTTSEVMVTNTDDLAGLNFATEDEGNLKTMMAAFRANVTSAGSEQIVQMLNVGRCDGYIGSLDTIVKNQLSQSQKNLMVTYQCYHAQAFAISESLWQKLDTEQQDIVRKAAENSAYTNIKRVQQNEEELLRTVENSNMRVRYLNMSTWVGSLEKVLLSYKSQYGELIDEVIVNMKNR